MIDKELMFKIEDRLDRNTTGLEQLLFEANKKLPHPKLYKHDEISIPVLHLDISPNIFINLTILHENGLTVSNGNGFNTTKTNTHYTLRFKKCTDTEKWLFVRLD